jgi:hypothetical protein
MVLQLKPASFLALLAGSQIFFLLKQRDEFANSTQEQEFKYIKNQNHG